MKLLRPFFVALIRVFAPFLVRLDASEMAGIPKKGPFILAMNHVNFLDGPILLARLFPRRVVSLAKKETWDNPFLGFAASSIGAIPITRGGADPAALRQVAKVLDEGGFLYINPEGTRSRDGVLRKGKAGVVAIAQRTGAPVIPLAFEGLEGFGDSIRRLRRTRAVLHVGEAFELVQSAQDSTKESREAAVDEIMRRIAALLPEEKRGSWAGLTKSEWRFTKTRVKEAIG
ncbi:MAG TPA: lysophospholipid acyltransferase family protein [Rectinemataceae bacterium]|nr:lysophospholipid acyltransferase family protein [Rectinemataceae bacterium]